MLIQLTEFLSQPLMLDASFMYRIASMAKSGELSTVDPIRNEVRMAAEKQATTAKSSAGRVTAIVPIFGMIDQRDSWILRAFGGTAIETLIEAIDICLNEPKIGGIVFDVHSHGGLAYGVKEGADYIFKARAEKPMVSISNSVMASAAAYLGMAASRVYATPSSLTGSIGTAWVHQEESKALAEAGITTTVFRSPEFKYEGNDVEPLTSAAGAHMAARCEQLTEMFMSDLAKYRGVEKSKIKTDYGQGRVLSAADALAAGMIDKIATFGEVCDGMRSGSIARSLAQTSRMEGAIDSAVMRNRLSTAML